MAQLVKNPPAMWVDLGSILGWEDPLEKEMAIHSSILACRIPWTIQSSRTKSRIRLSDFHDLMSRYTNNGRNTTEILSFLIYIGQIITKETFVIFKRPIPSLGFVIWGLLPPACQSQEQKL